MTLLDVVNKNVVCIKNNIGGNFLRTGSTILNFCLATAGVIKMDGFKVGNTLEDTLFPFSLYDLSYDIEDTAIREFYLKELGSYKLFEEKFEQEQYHYEYLKYGLWQKIEYNKFYFKEKPMGSRKLVIHSEDCISTLQILVRKNSTQIGIYIRSSDVINLLPVDLLAVVGIAESVIWKMGIPIDKTVLNMRGLIGSVHIYPDGDERRV